jgi:hypothetical protein
MTKHRGLRALLLLTAVISAVAAGRVALARVNGTVVRDVRGGR